MNKLVIVIAVLGLLYLWSDRWQVTSHFVFNKWTGKTCAVNWSPFGWNCP